MASALLQEGSRPGALGTVHVPTGDGEPRTGSWERSGRCRCRIWALARGRGSNAATVATEALSSLRLSSSLATKAQP